MSRYTRSRLEEDLKVVNSRLVGTGFYLEAFSRNGHTALDEFKNGYLVQNLCLGTPRECINVAIQYNPAESFVTTQI